MANGEVTQIRFDYAFGLVIQAGEYDVSIRISTVFTVSAGTGAAMYEPEEAASLGPLLDLHKVEVRSGEVRKDGRLRLSFADGRELTVEPHDQYEAFSVTGTARADQPRFDLVATPGGGLAAF